MRHRGLIMLDAVAGLLLIATLSIAMLGAIKQYRMAEARIAAERAAMAIAETTMLHLQSGQPAPEDDAVTRIEVSALQEGHVLPGKRWVRVTVRHAGATAALTGVVLREVLP
ncbi:MAG: hypothetical protein GC162_20210 [Planctomycetes bacterium]|nr:hypothetical protein [Planctomycetota bacterium]